MSNRTHLDPKEVDTVEPHIPTPQTGREPPRPKIKRVYKSVSVGEESGDFRVLLDGKPVMTPMRKQLSTRSRSLADAIAAEWDAQDPHIEPENMPLTRLESTRLDKVKPEPAQMIAALMSHVHADLLCYRAADQPSLRQRQDDTWQPILDWVGAMSGSDLIASVGVMPKLQSDDSISALTDALDTLDDGRLTAVQATAAITNSLALGLAMAHGQITSDEAFAAAMLDETFQMENWGRDEIAVARQQRIGEDLAAIGRYLKLLVT